MREYAVPNGMALSIWQNKYSRKKLDGTYQSWAERVSEVVDGNFLLDPRVHDAKNKDAPVVKEWARTKELAVAGVFATSGRHLQHGDHDQPGRKLELFSNCATALFSFVLLRQLLSGAGVGRDYSAVCCRVDWSKMPDVRLVLDEAHPDFSPDRFQGALEPLREARHKYDSNSEGVRWFTVEDSREGWAHIVEILETAAWQEKHKDKLFIFDFSNVRCNGSPIAGMQNRPASGPLPLMDAIAKVYSIKHAGMKPWKQSLYIDHYLAACVHFGGARRCLPAGTIVATDRGGVAIENIKIGDQVVTPAGTRKVTEIFDQGSQPTVYINHQFGNFECTANHQMAVFDSLTTWSFKPANQLREGDRLVFDPAGWDSSAENTRLPDYTHVYLGKDTNSAAFTMPSQLTPLIAWLVGFTQGNGYVGEKALSLTTNSSSEYGAAVMEKVVEALSCFGFSAKVNKVPGENALYTRVHSVHFVRYLSAWLKTPHAPLVVPECIKNSPREIRSAYLAGLFDADGSSKTRPLRICTTVYGDFASQVQELCLSIGVLTQLRRGEPRGNGWQTIFNVNTKGYENVVALNVAFEEHSLKLNYNIKPSRDGFSFPTEMVRQECRGHWISPGENQTSARVHAHTGRNSKALPVRVLSVEESGHVKDTWDIEVADIHQFTANGFVTHNSARMAVKSWRDRDIIEFVDIKRGGFLWSANNSVSVDAEFWQQAGDQRHTHGRRVFEAAVNAAYWDHSGEPGFINVDKLNQNKDGLEKITGDTYLNPVTYPNLHRRTRDMIENVLEHVKSLRYPFITNPCGEVCLSTWGGLCIIGDVCLAKVLTKQEALDAAGLMSRFLIRCNLMKSDYAAEVKRTNRIGVSLTGIHEFAWNMFGLSFRDMLNAPGDASHPQHASAKEFWSFIEEMRRRACSEAAIFSKEIGLSIPHTVCTVKPSGTVSKVMACTEGAHLPALSYYLRWVQYQFDDPIVPDLVARGYPMEDIGHRYHRQIIVGFPTKQPIVDSMGDLVTTADETTPEENFQWLRMLEHYWLGEDNEGNQLSYTLKYSTETTTYDEYMALILKWQPQVRACAVMPQSDWRESKKIYGYVPEQPITKEEYEEMMARITAPVEREAYDDASLACASGVCPIESDR